MYIYMNICKRLPFAQDGWVDEAPASGGGGGGFNPGAFFAGLFGGGDTPSLFNPQPLTLNAQPSTLNP